MSEATSKLVEADSNCTVIPVVSTSVLSTSTTGSKISKSQKKLLIKEQKKLASGRLQCNYLLPNKNGRQCNMTRREGENFCAQHIMLTVGEDQVQGKKRVLCPVDPGHSVWEKDLQKHIIKCGKGREERLGKGEKWFQKDVNIVSPELLKSLEGGPIENEEHESKDITSDEKIINYSKWIPILKNIYEQSASLEVIRQETLTHNGLDDRMSEVTKQAKHAIQQASLIGHMEKAGLLDVNNIVMEFGCGRAELSRYVSRACCLKEIAKVKNQETDDASSTGSIPGRFLFVDRDPGRMKLDIKLGKDITEFFPSLPQPTVSRLRADIKDLVLDIALSDLIPEDKSSDQRAIAISKHLCGCATDLTLQCLLNSSGLDSNNTAWSLQGLVIALCCRQICSYETYPPTSLNWLSSYGINREGFHAIKRMTAWAVCGRRADMKSEDGSEHPSGLNISQREEIGLMARRIIDAGRVKALREKGGDLWDVELVEYVENDISLENVCLIVKMKNN